MFKKKIAVLVAAALMSLTASSAFAAFSDLELIRVYYNRTTGAEIATDLGTISSVLKSAAAPGGVNFKGDFGTSNFAAYFALDRSTNQLWVSGVNSEVVTAWKPAIIGGATGLTSIKSGTDVMYATFGGANATTYAGNPVANGYKGKISATQGWFGNTVTAANTARTFSELNLANLAVNNTQSLWFFSDALTTVAANKIGTSVAQIITNNDGSTTVVTATPIPAAFYLMGSGLLGLVGLRRRNKVA